MPSPPPNRPTTPIGDILRAFAKTPRLTGAACIPHAAWWPVGSKDTTAHGLALLVCINDCPQATRQACAAFYADDDLGAGTVVGGRLIPGKAPAW